MIFQRIRTGIAGKPYIFVIFQGGGGSGPPAPSKSAHVGIHVIISRNIVCLPLKKNDLFEKPGQTL